MKNICIDMNLEKTRFMCSPTKLHYFHSYTYWGKKPQFSIQTQWELCFFNYCNYFAYNFAKVYNTLQQNHCLTTWTWKWCSRQFMFTLSFCMDIVDSFRSVSLQELQTTLYGGTIFSDESDGIQDLVYLKKRVLHYYYDKRKLLIINKYLN